MKSNPKVSIIVPSMNAVSYIKECMDSIVAQSLKDIEIICVDAGSQDGTLDILQEYKSSDSRVSIILSAEKSYGYQMNLGLDAATGDYIGIVEPDDWAERHMFETLYSAAEEYTADVVKANYYWCYSAPEVRNIPFENLKSCPYQVVCCPKNTIQVFYTTPAVWSGIYRRSMLTKHQLRFHMTPGASFQDLSFHLMVCTVAERFLPLDHVLYHYRKDNNSSSVYADGKTFCVSDELHYYESFLQKHPDYWIALIHLYMPIKYEKYCWNYSRITAEDQWPFLSLFSNEFSKHRREGLLLESMFSEDSWKNLVAITESPVRYFRNTCKKYYTRPKGRSLPATEVLKSSKVQNPDLSIIIPAYNVDKYIMASVSSALNQTLSNIEIICVDDGSDDSTLDLLLNLSDADSRITILHQVNMGQSSARNRALPLAKGRYIQFLDSDDALREDAAAFLVQMSDENQLDILYFDGQSVFESQELKEKHPYYIDGYEYDIALSNPVSGTEYYCTALENEKYRVSPCMACYRRSFLMENNITFLDGIIHEDNAFSFLCNMSAKRVLHTSEKFYFRFLRHGSTMTSEKSFENVYGFLACINTIDEKVNSLAYSERLFVNISRDRGSLIAQLRDVYQALPDKDYCRSKLNPLECIRLDELLSLSESRRVCNTTEEVFYHRSYKIGKAITWLPRKLRSLIRNLKQNYQRIKKLNS